MLFYILQYNIGLCYVLVQVDLDRSTMHPKFNLTRVQTNDLQIMDSTFYISKMLALVREPSRTPYHGQYISCP